MGWKHFFIDTIPKKLISYLPVDLRAKIKRRFLAWAQDDEHVIVDPLQISPLLAHEGGADAKADKEDQGSFSGNAKAFDPLIVNSLGFPVYEPMRAREQVGAGLSIDFLKQDPLPEINFEDRRGIALVSVCAMNYLYMARTMIASVREHHTSDEVAIYLLIVDWDGQELLEIQDATVLAGRALMIDRFDYMALKYTVIELCCACKSHFIRYLMATTSYQKILYFDIDIYIFSRLDEILACMDKSSLVVIPHTLIPPPKRDGVQVSPSLKDIMYAGTYNAGMFGMTVVPENAHFAKQWSELVTAPGAFLSDMDIQHAEQEQQIFNWLVNLANGVHVLKNTAYNVAYWNLHDRSLRYTAWDEPDQEAFWLVDGEPLVAFHFSGFSLKEPHRLSRYDFRYELYFLPSVTKLVEFYLDKLFENRVLREQEQFYRFDRFPSGLAISAEIRLIFKKYETFLWRDITPWSEAGEHYYGRCLFLPIPETSSLLPAAIYYIYKRRRDLQVAFPHAHVEPQPMLGWFSQAGLTEEPLLYQYFNLYRPVVPKLEGIHAVLVMQHEHPALFEGLDLPMSHGRSKLISSLKEAGLETATNQIRFLEFEYFALSPIYLLWKFIKQQVHLQNAYPDFLFTGAPALAQWLRENASEYFLEPKLADIFLQKAQGHALARIFSFLNESWELASQSPLALVGQNKDAFIRALLGQLHFDRQFDLDDIVMYAWVMEIKPWAGLPLTFELLVNASRQPSPLLAEGQDALLGSLLDIPGFRDALAEYRAQIAEKRTDEIEHRNHQRRIEIFDGGPYLSKSEKDGVNFFGFFKSPIGLGSLSHGLALAFRSASVQVQKSVLSNASMDQSLRPDDFIRTYDYSLNTNLFVSYPHLMYRLLGNYPAHVVKGRKNIVYLAWEQRDGHPAWQQNYAEFDQVWALSHFAAESFRRYMKRDDVVAVPGVVDFESFPLAATKNDMGLDPERFIFLYVFDASSSIERKNPEAAIRAFSQAFGPHEKVQLLLKVTNAHRLDCRQRLHRLVALAASSGMDIRFLMSNLSRQDVLKTISAVDCYVSLHRAEGFGYTCAEAMAYAKPVIATNYSGTTEFMDAQSGFLVNYTECEIKAADGPFQPGSVWAEPDVEHAAAQMRQVYLHQKAAEKIGLAGQARVRQLLSAERIGQIAAAALAGTYKDSSVVLR